MNTNQASTGCVCASRTDTVVEEFSVAVAAAAGSFRRLRARGLPQWWLHLSVCDECGQHWLVAQEERLNDVFVLRKIADEEAQAVLAGAAWPIDLDFYEALLRLGAEHSHHSRFVDVEDALPVAIDLVGQRPNITNVEIANLVNLPEDAITSIASRARQQIAALGYPYPWQAVA